jgi:hypothetical protein
MIVTRDLGRTVFEPPVAMLYEECEIPPGLTLDAWRRGIDAGARRGFTPPSPAPPAPR